MAACRIIHTCQGVVGVLPILFYCCFYHHHHLLSLIIKRLNKKPIFIIWYLHRHICNQNDSFLLCFCYAIVLVFATSPQSWICRVVGIRANLYLLFLPWQFVKFFGIIYLGKKVDMNLTSSISKYIH